MTRTWLSRVAQMLKAPKKPARQVSGKPRLGVEALEDRSVPASYTFDATANTLLIALGTNEVLTVTADGTNTTFALSGGSSPVFTPASGSDTATSGSGTATLGIVNSDLTGSLTINNSGVTEDSNNDVTFAGGTVTSGTITVTLTDANGGSDQDDITVSSGAALAGTANLSTQNGGVFPTVTVAATTATVAEGGTPGTITFTRTGDTSQALTVNFSVGSGSTATLGTDYTLSGGTGFTFNQTAGTGTVTFAAGSSTATVTVNVTDDTIDENTETVVLNATAATNNQYTVGTTGTATVSITDNDPTVTTPAISVSATNGAEGGSNGTITFTRTGDTSQALTVNFSVGSGSTATLGTDYTLSGGTGFTFNQTAGTGTVTFAAGSSTATVTVNVTDDNINENTETVVVNVGAATGGQYTIATGTATASIADNDGNGNGNGNNGTPTRKRPAFSGATVIGDQMVLFGPDGEVKAVVPVTRGTLVAFSDLTGDGNGDVVMISPLISTVIDGLTGRILAVFTDFDADRVPDILLFSTDTGAPTLVFLSRSGQSFPLS